MTVNANLPNPATPFLGPDGRVSPVWIGFLLALFERSGGTTAPPDLTVLQKNIVDLFTLDSGQVQVGHASLTQRVSELEQIIAGMQPTPPINGTVLVIGQS